jgi:hypothetical protein
VDSDNDGLLDRDEDANGDGLLGCCLTTCHKPGSKQQTGCKLNSCGCGQGQQCVGGLCSPAVSLTCADGETDPKKKDTFGAGQLDNGGGNFCRDATENKLYGRLPLVEHASTKGDWRVALAPAVAYQELTIGGAGSKEAAAALDRASDGVAGFVVSRGTTHAAVTGALTARIVAIQAALGGGWSVIQVASGIVGKSHDGYDAVIGTTLRLSTSGAAAKAADVRAKVVAGLLGRPPGQLGNLPAPFGSATTDLVLRMTTVKRVAFKLDSSGNPVLDAAGYPVDSGDTSKWRLVVMGGLADWSAYQKSAPQPGFGVDDLADGTALAGYQTHLDDDCDASTIKQLPKADFIWVVDESSAMSDNRVDLVNSANAFFSHALSSGLDFRMGVTGVNSPTGSQAKTVGHLCSKISTNSADDGGISRFLLPSEQVIFDACIKNPPGYGDASPYGLVNAAQAVKQHLPRAWDNKPDRVRAEAQLALIVLSDATPQSLHDALGSGSWSSACELEAAQQAKLDAALKPYRALLSGATDPEAKASFYLIGGVCPCSCGAQIGHGYLQLARELGGQSADVCQKDLGPAMNAVIDSVVASASPLQLQHQAISASLAVAMDGVMISRSRTNGFDHRAARRKLVFHNVKYKKGSEVLAAYRSWRKGPSPCP